MSIITLAPSVKDILKEIYPVPEETAVQLFITGIKDYLKECEMEILEYETKYNCSFKDFKEQISLGNVPDEFSYETEKDIIKWEDLTTEKWNWLKLLRKIEALIK